MQQPMWTPSAERIAAARMTQFMEAASAQTGRDLRRFTALHQWSVDEPAAFWELLWSYSGVIASRRADVPVENPDRMPGARWFPGARLNFAENLLRRRDDAEALVFRGEDRVSRRLSHRQLRDAVSTMAQALRARGVRSGDRVASILPNMPEAIVGMLATTSIGAVWSSCSPDFGVRGVLDRFGQIEPRILIASDGYYYGGKTFNCLDKIADIAQQLPSVEQVVLVPYIGEDPARGAIADLVPWGEFVSPYSPAEIEFEQLPFDHPVYIVYSSGTTGAPKCMVHGAGGTLLQHLKEQQLHADLRRGDRVFYFSTLGWMMWNWLASALASEATLLLYDGSPFHPDGDVLFDFARDEGMSIFGTSAKYIDALNKAHIAPRETHDLSALRTLLSTGSPLVPEAFDYIYRSIKSDLCVASISGGTDIMGCFVGGCPILPVWRGEIQAPGLGMKIEVWGDEGERLPVGEKGELVCSRAFPSMPVEFWNDPDGSRYREAYFERFPGVWCHGDYVAETAHGGYVIYGRSDAVLNPGGVRIGTAEIYRQAEQIEEVVESLVIGQQWQNDVRVVLFVRLRDGITLDDALIDRLKRHIRTNASPRHVPAKIVQVADIPRTKSGKIVELAVRNVVHGQPVKNTEALANPASLELYRDLPELVS